MFQIPAQIAVRTCIWPKFKSSALPTNYLLGASCSLHLPFSQTHPRPTISRRMPSSCNRQEWTRSPHVSLTRTSLNCSGYFNDHIQRPFLPLLFPWYSIRPPKWVSRENIRFSCDFSASNRNGYFTSIYYFSHHGRGICCIWPWKTNNPSENRGLFYDFLE